MWSATAAVGVVGVERLLQGRLQPRREDLAAAARERLRDRAQVGVVDDPLDALIDVGCGVIGLGHAARPPSLAAATPPGARGRGYAAIRAGVARAAIARRT